MFFFLYPALSRFRKVLFEESVGFCRHAFQQKDRFLILAEKAFQYVVERSTASN
jgi:hypothetical protein